MCMAQNEQKENHQATHKEMSSGKNMHVNERKHHSKVWSEKKTRKRTTTTARPGPMVQYNS